MKIRTEINGKAYEGEIPSIKFMNEDFTRVVMQEVKPALPAVGELLRMMERLNKPVITKSSGEIHTGYLEAALKSRVLAALIREAEGEMGRYDGLDLRFYISVSGDTHKYSYHGFTKPHAEYFATEAGAILYKSAMGDDLKHLLSA